MLIEKELYLAETVGILDQRSKLKTKPDCVHVDEAAISTDEGMDTNRRGGVYSFIKFVFKNV